MPFRKPDPLLLARIIISLAAVCAVFCPGADPAAADGRIRVFFTSPGRDGAQTPDNPESALVRLIGSARKSFYGAFYDISSSRVAAALDKARRRGVDVRLVTEKDNFDNRQISLLIRAGVPVVPDRSRGLMHNKFAVVDGVCLWTGSYNTTGNCAYRNNNNAVLIESPELAAIYLSEFSEMFESKIFGNRKDANPFESVGKKYHVRIDDADINAYFSPDDNVERIIVQRIRKAERSIDFLAFSFTSDAIAAEMIERHRAGVAVRGVIEKRGSRSKESEFVKLKTEGIPVKIDRNRHAMHHKVIVIDDRLVITGSYNFSRNANRKNDENVLMIASPEVASAYMREFDRLYR